MKTKGEIRSIFLRYLDEATKKGVDLPSTKNADYRDKFDYFLDSALKYITTIIKIPEVFTVTQYPIPNLLGVFQGFDIVQVLDTKTFAVTGCKSMYFEMDNVGVATIKVNDVVVQTISNTVKRSFTAYRVLTNATSTDKVELTFDALYPFNIRNIGMYGYTFSTSDDVPTYMPYVAYDMPSDFMEFDNVIIKSDPRIYEQYVAYKWENTKKVVLNYYDKGSFDIHYFKYHATIPHDALDTTEIGIEEKAVDLVALQTAIKSTAADNPALSSWLRSLYVEEVQNIMSGGKPIETEIRTIYSMI